LLCDNNNRRSSTKL